MDNQPGFMPLGSIGQGYANPAAGSGQSWSPPMSFMQGPGDFRSHLQAWAAQRFPSMQNNDAGGPAGPPANPPAFNNLAGYGAASPPPNPPAFGGTDAGDTTAATPGSIAGNPPSQSLANPPASGGPVSYGQRMPMMGNAFNAAGFGGLGVAMGGQGPGARYWARLNNIGGT